MRLAILIRRAHAAGLLFIETPAKTRAKGTSGVQPPYRYIVFRNGQPWTSVFFTKKELFSEFRWQRKHGEPGNYQMFRKNHLVHDWPADLIEEVFLP